MHAVQEVFSKSWPKERAKSVQNTNQVQSQLQVFVASGTSGEDRKSGPIQAT